VKIIHLAIDVLNAVTPDQKIKAAHNAAKLWGQGESDFLLEDKYTIPKYPGRPEKPILVSAKDVKRRRLGSLQGRCALLHAIAHIEYNAVNLAADIIARYSASPRIDENFRRDFIDDWIKVLDDEARHFTLINNRLLELGSFYGAFCAHAGLWEAAISTSNDLAARLVVVPMILEARGLDVTPGMVEKLKSAADSKSAAILSLIYTEEIPHVQTGTRWFMHVCKRENQVPDRYFNALLHSHYKGTLKPPFNDEARALAGMPRSFYAPETMQICAKH